MTDKHAEISTSDDLAQLLLEAEFSDVDTDTTWNQFYAANISAALARTRER